MSLRKLPLRALPQTTHSLPHRHLHARTTPPPIPSPTPFVPNASTFLSLIGRNLSAHAAKFPTWASLFSLTSTQLRDLGVEPARSRRYLLWWRDRFRKGVWGVGGDLRFVDAEGRAEVRVVEVGALEGGDQGRGVNLLMGGVGVKKMVVNTKPTKGKEGMGMSGGGAAATGMEKGTLRPVEGMKVRGLSNIAGPFVEPVKGTGGSVGVIRVREGMWEVRRGVKVDGGERRKAQVRRKRLLAERKTSRA